MAFRPHLGICICHGKTRWIEVKAGYCHQGNEERKRSRKGIGKMQERSGIFPGKILQLGAKRLPKTFPKKTKISHSSDRRERENRVYSKERIIFLEANPVCFAQIHGRCTYHATDVQHMIGRTGKRLLDKKHWKGVCRGCHTYIDTHPQEAFEKGWAEKRITKDED